MSVGANAVAKLGLLGALYFSQGLPFGFFTQGLPVLMRQRGYSLTEIGLSSLLAFVFVPAHPGLSEISFSHLKQLARQGAEIARYCPPSVRARLEAWAATLPQQSESGGHV